MDCDTGGWSGVDDDTGKRSGGETMDGHCGIHDCGEYEGPAAKFVMCDIIDADMGADVFGTANGETTLAGCCREEEAAAAIAGARIGRTTSIGCVTGEGSTSISVKGGGCIDPRVVGMRPPGPRTGPTGVKGAGESE